MTEEEVVALMKSSASKKEWYANVAAVEKFCDGLPSFWYNAIILSGVCYRTVAKWK